MRHICTNNICTSLTEKQLKIEMLILEKKEIAHIPKANNVAIKLQKNSLGAQKKAIFVKKREIYRRKQLKKEKPKKKKKQQRPILMEVTRRPQALRSRPILLAVTPFPRPLTTPPVTNTYFIFVLFFFFAFLYLSFTQHLHI